MTVTIAGCALRMARGTVYSNSLESKARHSDLIRVAREHEVPEAVHAAEQGFITSDHRFVDREEARRIALNSGQLSETLHASELFSEDLF